MTDKEKSDFLNLKLRVVILEERIKDIYKIILETQKGYENQKD